MREDTWAALDAQFSKFPMMKAEPVPPEEFDGAVVGLPFSVPADYRQFVLRYGGALVGPYPIFGLRQADAMGSEEASFLDITQRFRDDGWQGVDEWLVVSMDHAGNPIGISADGRIWCSDHESGEVVPVALTFERYLRSKCLGLNDP